ncbi:hypothetical protein [Mycobacteroides abscessus]
MDQYENLKADSTPLPWCEYLGDLWAGKTAVQMEEYDRLAGLGTYDQLGLDEQPIGEKLFLGDAKRVGDVRLIQWLRVHADELVAAARSLREIANLSVSQSRADGPWSGPTSGGKQAPLG